MRKLLNQPFLLMVITFGLLATGCKTETKTATKLPDVAIDLVDTANATDMTVTFTPSEGTASYMFAIGVEGDKSSFLEKVFPGTEYVKGDKPTTFTFTHLDPQTYYTVFAVASDSEGNAGPVSMPVYNTITGDFQVTTYYLTDNTAGFRIKASNDYISYTYYLGTPDDREEFNNNNIEGAITKSNSYRLVENYFSLTPDTEYVFYVRAIDRTGKETKTFEIPAKTKPLDSNEIPNVKFEINNTDFYQQSYTVTPNDKCGMIVLFQYELVYHDEMFGGDGIAGDFMGMLDDWSNIPENQLSGLDYMKCYKAIGEKLEAKPITKELNTDINLGVFIIIYDMNLKPVGFKKFINKIPPVDNKLPIDNLGGTIKVSAPTFTTINVDIALNSNTLAGLFDIFDGEALDTEMKKPEFDMYSTVHNKLLADIKTSGYFLYKNAFPSLNETLEDKDMLPGKKYYVVLCPMNTNGPQKGGWGKMVMSEPFYIPTENLAQNNN